MFYFDCRQRGSLSCVGSISHGIRDVDAMDAWSTDQGSTHVLNIHLSELRTAVRSRIITVQIVCDRWTLDLIATVGLRSNEQIKPKPLLFINARSNPDPSSSIERPRFDRDYSQKDARS